MLTAASATRTLRGRGTVGRMQPAKHIFDNSVFDDRLHAECREAAASGPVATDSMTGAHVVLRHADVEALAHSKNLVGVGMTLFDFMGIENGPLRDWYSGLMFTNEGDAHHRLRRLVQIAFTPRSVDRLRNDAALEAGKRMQRLVNDGGGDLVQAFSRFPTWMMCRLIGVPEGDAALFGGWLDTLSPVFGFMEPEQIQAADLAIIDLLAYVEQLVEHRSAQPGDALVDGLIAASAEGDRLSPHEVAAMIANLLVGGHDTTESQLACVLLRLLRHPQQAARVRDDSSLASSAVSEGTRIEPSLPVIPRTVSVPFDLIGQRVEVGELVFLSVASANRDPAAWSAPDAFDLDRFATSGSSKLLSFGAGAHYCLGTSLAKLTMEQSVAALASARPVEPTLDPWTLPWRCVLGRSPTTMPVSVS